jgi:hypothetical protein
MNDSEIENILMSLAPARPRAVLTQRIDQELEQDMRWAIRPNRHVSSWFSPMLWTALGAAAAVIFMSLAPSDGLSLQRDRFAATVSTPLSPSVLPVSTIREVVQAQDEGIRYNSSSQLPEQHMKIVTMERRAWIDPRDGAHITIEVPREDNVIMPVSFQ